MKVIERKKNWTNKLNTTEPDGMMTKMRLMVMGMMVMVRKYTDKPESTEPDSHPDYAASTRGSTPACSHLQSTQEADKGISLAHSSQMSIHQPGRQPPSSKGSWTKNLKTINMDYHCHHFHWKYKDLWSQGQKKKRLKIIDLTQSSFLFSFSSHWTWIPHLRQDCLGIPGPQFSQHSS